jgi:hypothetical protein
MVVLGGFKGVLDLIFAIASVAYGLRRLSRFWTGAAIRVMRTSDNSELDIGFIGEDLDVVTLLAFVGLANGEIVIWYDQSGNGRHAVSPTAASRPRIVVNGVLQTQNGKPEIRFDGVDDYLAAASPLIDTTHSLFILFTPTIENEFGTVFGQWKSGENGRFYVIANQVSVGPISAGRLNVANTSSTGGGGSGGSAIDVAISNTPTLITSISTTGSEQWKLFKNGAEWDSATISRVYTGVNSAIGSLNGTGSLFPFDGTVSELISFPSVLSTTNRQTLERNQGKYRSITVA